MNILTAIYAGQTGFLKSKSRMDQAANRIAQMSLDPQQAQETLASDIVDLKLSSTAAKANLKTISVSDKLSQELVQVASSPKRR